VRIDSICSAPVAGITRRSVLIAIDPFVIALAERDNLTVVTSEKRGSADHPKIPLVCEWRGIQCINLVEFFRAEGWNF